MKGNMLTIARKELAKFFSNRVSALVSIVLPGLLIFVLWSFMGSAMQDMFSPDEDVSPVVGVVNEPASVRALAQDSGIQTVPEEALPDADAMRERIDADVYKRQVRGRGGGSGAPLCRGAHDVRLLSSGQRRQDAAQGVQLPAGRGRARAGVGRCGDPGGKGGRAGKGGARLGAAVRLALHGVRPSGCLLYTSWRCGRTGPRGRSAPVSPPFGPPSR